MPQEPLTTGAPPEVGEGPWWLLPLAAGALDARAVVEGDVEIRDLSSRNEGILVTGAGDDGVFLKRGPRTAGEAAVLADLARRPGLAGILPRVRRHDPGAGTLLLDAGSGATDLWRLHRRLGRFPVALGGAVGRALGALHRATAGARGDGAPPAVAGLHRPEPADLREMTPAGARLVAIVQSQPALVAGLDELRRGWRPLALVHGDVKWPNLVATTAGDGPSTVRLVDWEHAGPGDPGWDLGAAMAAYVSFWLHSIPPPRGRAVPDGLAASAEFPIEVMRPAIRALWQGHAAASGAIAGPDALHRAVLWCAAALLRTASEEAAGRDALSGRASLHLQVAANVMADPGGAATGLLGIVDLS